MNNLSPIQKPRRGRPPKVNHGDSDTRARLIRSGVETLTESSFVSAGIEGILKKVGVPKGSFYHYFKNKEEFGLAVINEYDAYFARKLDTYLLDQETKPLQRLANFVENTKKSIKKYDYKRGCLVGNLGQEVGLLPESFRQRLQAIFSSWQARVCQCLVEAQKTGDLSADANCEALAEYFWIGWEGAVTRAKLMEKVAPLELYFQGFISGLPR